MEPFNVMIVDDEKDFLETLVKRLEKRNLYAAGAESAEKAILLMQKKEFDVVILDIKLPGGMDGIEALREMKKIQPLTEVIFLTGHSSIEAGIEGMKLGAFDYILKPVKLEDLFPKLILANEKKKEMTKKAETVKNKTR